MADIKPAARAGREGEPGEPLFSTPTENFEDLHESISSLQPNISGSGQDIKLWWKNYSLEFFRQDEDIDFGIITSAKKELLNDFGTFHDLLVQGGLGGFYLLPDFDRDSIFGASAVLTALAGIKIRPADFLTLRAAVETRPSLLFGNELSLTPNIPVSIGASAILNLSSSAFVVGATSHLYLVLADVQDSGSATVFANDITPWIYLDTPSVKFRVELINYINGGTKAAGSIAFPFTLPFDLGEATVGLSGSGMLKTASTGNAVMEPPYFGGSLTWNFESSDKTYGASALINIGNETDAFSESIGAQLEQLAIPQNTLMGRRLTCGDRMIEHYKGGDVAVYRMCNMDQDRVEMRCDENPLGEISCRYDLIKPDPDKDYRFIRYELAATRLDYEGKRFKVTDFKTSSPSVNLIKENETENALVSAALDKLSWNERAMLLAIYTQGGYKTYDKQGLVVPDGVGNVDDISQEEVYSNLRTMFRDGLETIKPTTVCRGFAKKAAAFGARLGFDTYPVSIQTSGMPHDIILFRRKGSDDGYSVIDRGQEIVSTGSLTLSQAIRNYAQWYRLPPQMVSTVYDSQGKVLQIIRSETFDRIENAIGGPDVIDTYLQKP